MVTLLQRADANFHDLLFVLHHVLRCGPGFGRWAACLIQPNVPSYENLTDVSDSPNADPFDHPALAEILVILSIVTSPVRGREAFIRDLLTPTQLQLGAANPGSGGPAAVSKDWVVIDSDGEDEPGSSSSYMKENDLVAILNQIPIAGNY